MSTPKSCVGGRVRSSKRRKNRTRRKIHKKRVVSSSSRLSDGSFDIRLPSFTNPTFQGPSLSLVLEISRFIINLASWTFLKGLAFDPLIVG